MVIFIGCWDMNRNLLEHATKSCKNVLTRFNTLFREANLPNQSFSDTCLYKYILLRVWYYETEKIFLYTMQFVEKLHCHVVFKFFVVIIAQATHSLINDGWYHQDIFIQLMQEAYLESQFLLIVINFKFYVHSIVCIYISNIIFYSLNISTTFLIYY